MWKQIPGFPKYEINEFGVVRNADTHYITAQRMNRYGYLYVQLSDGINNHVLLVHRLVAIVFIPNPKNLPIVNHIDECSVHNSADNLEWVSYKENSNHGTRNERIIRQRKNPVLAIDDSGRIVYHFSSKHEAGRVIGVSEAAIRKAIVNKSKCCNLYWVLESETSFSDNLQSNLEYLKKAQYKTGHYHVNNQVGRIALRAIDVEGNTIYRFRSKNDASKKLGVSPNEINTAIKNHTQINSMFLVVDAE